jgi:hypothetical protein
MGQRAADLAGADQCNLVIRHDRRPPHSLQPPLGRRVVIRFRKVVQASG